MNDIPQRDSTSEHYRPARRTVLTGGAALVLSGCTLPPVISSLATIVRVGALGVADAAFTNEYVAKLPYATISAKIGRGQRSLLVLARRDGPDLHWISSDRAVLVTRNGRLVRALGVAGGVDLRDTAEIAADPVASESFSFPGRWMRVVDLGQGHTYGIPIESTFTIRGREVTAILDHQFDTLHVTEQSDAVGMRWRFTNEFWFDFTTGFCWKSIQHFAPDVAPVAIEVLKPAIA